MAADFPPPIPLIRTYATDGTLERDVHAYLSYMRDLSHEGNAEKRNAIQLYANDIKNNFRGNLADWNAEIQRQQPGYVQQGGYRKIYYARNGRAYIKLPNGQTRFISLRY